MIKYNESALYSAGDQSVISNMKRQNKLNQLTFRFFAAQTKILYKTAEDAFSIGGEISGKPALYRFLKTEPQVVTYRLCKYKLAQDILFYYKFVRTT